jgi:hypothetical protein
VLASAPKPWRLVGLKTEAQKAGERRRSVARDDRKAAR